MAGLSYKLLILLCFFTCSYGQLPRECTLDKEVFDFQCCPDTALGECGGATRGLCVNITDNTVDPGADPGGGLWGLETPPSKLGLIPKQALQIIIIIGAKIIISICTFKRYRTMSEDSRKKQCTTDIRTFFASERLV